MRIVAVTADASLITALTSMLLDWEIVAVRDPADAKSASEGAVAALVDSGTTAGGVETAKVLWNHGVTLPCLVIGESDPPPGTRVRVLARPFSLNDLTTAVDEVASAPPVDPGRLSVTEEPALEEDALEEPALEEAALEDAEPVEDSPPVEEDMVERGAGEDETGQPAAFAEAGATHAAGEAVEYEDTRGYEVEPEAFPDAGELADASEPARETTAAAVVRELESLASEPIVEPESPASEPSEEPEPERLPPAASPGPAASRPALAPEPSRAEGGLRRFLRRREAPPQRLAEQESEADPMLARLTDAIGAIRDIEVLIHELPVLAQPRAMAHAFLGEVVEMFAPQVAAVFAPAPDGAFGVISAHGLSAVEAGLKVPSDQPLFADICRTLEAVLVSPVDLAQGLVAGIGGARTEALIAAPLAVGNVCHAIVMVGRQEFTEFDLELLGEQAEEAAPGLAVAQLIDRLRSL